MTTLPLLEIARTPSHDLYGRMERVQGLIEEFIKEAIALPEDVSFLQVLVLARMAKEPKREVKATGLRTGGYFAGSNAAYTLKALLDRGYLASRPGEDRRIKWVSLTDKGKKLGTDVAMQINFVEVQIGKIFTEGAYRAAREFLAETVYGGEVERPRAKKLQLA